MLEMNGRRRVMRWLLPRWLTVATIVLLCVAALVIPAWQFAQVLPGIAGLYSQPLTPGWGLYLMAIGLLTVIVAAVLMALMPPPEIPE